MPVTIYHNPLCTNSRKALEIIRSHGIEPKIIEYLGKPLSPEKLRHLIKDEMHMMVRELVRTKEPAYADMKLDGADDDTLLAAMAAHPVLMNRPIVVTDKGAKLCRPGERVEELL
ncbi:MAG TPA: arsenate reductase (glutaredoxin) [Rhizorhapis sp.]|nr:arsenate reductase (glutaredoxin) [Rhizorhapis sp.]